MTSDAMGYGQDSTERARRIPAENAIEQSRTVRQAAKWPGKTSGNRLAPVPTPLHQPKFRFERNDRIFTMGSCFARNIEDYLDNLGFNVPTLSFEAPEEENDHQRRASSMLNKFTPPSMFQEIERSARYADARSDAERETILFESLYETIDSQWLDLEIRWRSPASKSRALERRRDIQQLHAAMFECEVVTLTFGLVEAWYDANKQQYVQLAPTPEMLSSHPGRFEFDVLDYERVLSGAIRAIDLLNGRGCEKKIIVTTSPIPLSRTFQPLDVLVANMAGKSVLRAVCHELWRRFPNVDYFPSYEIAMLSRDSGILESDQIHLKDEFVGRIVEQMLSAYVPSGQNTSANDQTARAWSQLRAGDNAAALATIGAADETPDAKLVKMLASDSQHDIAKVGETAARVQLMPRQCAIVAEHLVRSNDWKNALTIAERGLSTPIDDKKLLGDLVYYKAVSVLHMSGVKTAQSFIDSMLNQLRTPPVLTAAAEIAVAEESFEKAEAFLDEALGWFSTKRLTTKRAPVLTLKAQLVLRKGRKKAAKGFAEAALVNDPTYEPAHLVLQNLKNIRRG
jgi:hypothetical protein